MAPPRKKPLPPGTVKAPSRKPSTTGISSGGVHKHSSTAGGHRSISKASSASAAAAAAAATALAAGGATSSSGRSKPKPKVHRHSTDTLNMPAYEREDNGMRFSSIPIVQNINQKNYYTDYLKKDEQEIWTNRLISAEAKEAEAREAAAKLAPQEIGTPDSEEEAELSGSKVVVIHIGSRTMRIGLASDTFPTNVPMVIARPTIAPLEEMPPQPVRLREDSESSEPLFGQAFEEGVTKLEAILKARLRAAKKRSVPNARELVASYNRRSQWEQILDINDPEQIEWEDLGSDKKYVTGAQALRVAEDPDTVLHYWPIQYGVFNETGYTTRQELLGDIQLIIEAALREHLEINPNEYSSYSALLVIPDLFEKTFIYEMNRLLFTDMGFSKVAILQEAICATFGAGLSNACVVDIGAQTTTIACVDEGIIIPDSRINLKYGGDDITEYFTKLILRASFPWADVDLSKAVDRAVMTRAKERYCTLFETEVAMQLGESIIRKKGEKTKKFPWRMYDEVFLAPMAMFLPSVMGLPEKLAARHAVMARSRDLYDGSFNDQESGAQNQMANQRQASTVAPPDAMDAPKASNGNGTAALPTEHPTPSRRPSPSIQSMAGDVPDSTVDASVRRSVSPAAVASPAPLPALSTPQGDKVTRAPSPTQGGVISYFPPVNTAYHDELRVANIPSLEYAVATSIRFASLPALSTLTTTNLGEDRSRRLYSSILVVGSGALVPGLGYMLEDRVRSLKGGTVSVIPPPRDMDPGVLVWKGASVYARLKTPEREAFMTKKEWDLYNIRGIPLRLLYVF